MAWIYHESNRSGSMTQAEMENNAKEIYSQLTLYGWSLNAICGVLGNWQWESYINPAQWQIGYPIGGTKGGVGLGQWTPPSHWRDWANLNGYDLYDGFRQVEYLNLNNIYYNSEYHGSQWNNNPSPYWTWEYYKTATESPETCAEAYHNQWEQSSDPSSMDDRKNYARKWYLFFGSEPPTPTGHIPLWLLYKWANMWRYFYK